MNIIESMKSAVKNVFSNKMRAVLTMLGIIIGIGSVIIITSIGAGSTAQITENFDAMGVGKLVVRTQFNRNISNRDVLKMDDYELLKGEESLAEEFKFISPEYTASATVKLLDPRETKNASITGVMDIYKDIDKPTILYGRYINASDVDMGGKVLVINDTTAEKVFGYCNENVLGQKVSIKTSRGTQKYTVEGITENSNAEMEQLYEDMFDESMVMPITTLQRLFGTKQLSSITIVVNDTEKMDDTASRISDALDKFHGTTDKYYVQNTMSMMEQINSTMSMIVTFISFVAGISLVVGGIGVMNIMLVSVTERTREIGTRKALGAKNFHVRLQFVTEAVIISGIGGAIGVVLGTAIGTVIAVFMEAPVAVSATVVVASVLFSMAIGVFFGYYPANKAARLDPIEALRYE